MFQRLLTQLVLPVIIVGIGAGGLMWLSAKNTPPQRVVQRPAPLLVETVVLPAEVPQFQIQVSGNVVPSREVTLSAQVDGVVTFKGKSIESGRHVRAKTALLQIDRGRFDIQVNKMQSEIARVEADLRRLTIEEGGTQELIELAKREVKLAEAASQRLEALVQRNATSAAESEAVERAEVQSRNTLQLLLNQSELIPIRRQQLQAQLDLARLELSLAQLNLDHTKIAAPFSGVIVSVMVEQGDYVQAGDPLLKLVDMSTVDVQCSLQLDDLYWLWSSTAPRDAGQGGVDVEAEPSRRAKAVERSETAAPVSPVVSAESSSEAADVSGHVFEVPNVEAIVTSDIAGREFHWPGRLARFEGAGINRNTRTVPCRVHVAQPIRPDAAPGPPALMRGMYVTVTLNVETPTRLLRIPARAVQPDGRVLTVADGKLRVHTIRPARVMPGSVIVRADATQLAVGDRIVVTQLVAPIDGSTVREMVRPGEPAERPDANRNDVP